MLRIWHNGERNIKLDQTKFINTSSLSVRELEKLIPWFNVQEGIQRLRDISILEWIFHLILSHP